MSKEIKKCKYCKKIMRMDDYRCPSEFFESINCSNRCSALSRKQKGVTWEKRYGVKRAKVLKKRVRKTVNWEEKCLEKIGIIEQNRDVI